MGKKDYQTVLIEQLVDQNKAILEYVSDVPAMAARLERVEQDVSELEQDMKIVKAAVTDVSQQVANHGRHITRLHAA